MAASLILPPLGPLVIEPNLVQKLRLHQDQSTPREHYPRRPAWREISAACCFTASLNSAGLFTTNEQSRPASTRAIQSRSEVEERRRTPQDVSRRAVPIEGTCRRASPMPVSSRTSTDQRSSCMVASDSSTRSGVSKPGGRSKVSESAWASSTLSSLKRRLPLLRWQ